MRKILKSLLAIFIILALNSQFLIGFSNVQANNDDYTTYRDVDKNSFNEYRYLITKEFFKIKNKWYVDNIIDSDSLIRIKSLAEKGFNYLPDNNLKNESFLNDVNTAISKAIKYDNSEAAYNGLIKSIGAYLDKTDIKSISGEVVAIPKEGNAPLNVTLRVKAQDPSGETIPKYNYIWWMNSGTRRVNLGTGPSINYTFREEGIFTVFVDVKSAHKNNKGYVDILPYRGQVKINVKEKIASLIVKVNSQRVGDKEVLKFSPTQAKYGLLFDATNSIPTGSAKFIKTSWDFGNGEKREYNRGPKIERVVYNKDGEYNITLKLETNIGNIIEKKFIISIHDPIALININPSDGFLGDKFTFSALNVTNDEDLTYNWSIVDIINDKVIFRKQAKVFKYTFPKKGHFNIRLEVTGTDSGRKSIDTKNIFINSRPPVAKFIYSVPEKNKPNKVLLDATDSYDPDFTDIGKLKYYWEIDGKRVFLEDANDKGSLGYYTFDTIGKHNVILRVEDPDNIEGTYIGKVNIDSTLSVDFSANPRAIKRGDSITFIANSSKAQFYEWDFGDGEKSNGGTQEKIIHQYKRAGIFSVKLKVSDEKGNTNSYSKLIYVGDGENPMAILNITSNVNSISIEKKACNGQDAYIANRIESISFNGTKSINIDGSNTGLNYSLKIGQNKYFTQPSVSYKFDELGCFPIILKVTSKKNLSTSTTKAWIKVKNLKPTLSAVTAKADNLETDPVVVTVNAVGATDKDGVITSYLWYYYTDLDSEPQDFRSTTGPSTKFVLPKITGNYYFVVLLTDDSEDRISSQELGKKASITLAGNNINVPIVELKIPDNSVHVKEEVTFQAKVQNILKQDLTNKVKYFWDFDGDGFYDLETKKSTATYSYDKPGSYYVKVKVKHKGFSNTKTAEVHVANSLNPNLDYISIGNKFIFTNKTTGSYESIIFDLGDGTKVKDENYFTHTYTDGRSSHIVKILASDSNTIKKKETKVVKNIRNLLKAKKNKSGVIFSSIAENSDNEIILEKRRDDISFVYYGNKQNFGEIAADINLEKDSDLNGGKDDDTDVFSSNYPYINVKLDNNKNQLVRVFVKDKDGVTILSKDYKIIKKYIKDGLIKLDDVVFTNVSSAQKQKLEELKNLASSVSGDDKKIVNTYIARLKDEWSDENERTKVIYEFEGFLEGSQIQNKNEIIDKLEELLLKENDNNDTKTTALRALQGLTPATISCGENFDLKEYKTCKEYIDASLETIKNNDDIQQNKALGKQILQIIGASDKLTAKEKMDYKATLKTLIYGSVENMPKEEVKEVIDENNTSGTSGVISSILSTIGYILLVIVILFVLGFIGMFVYSKISKKDKDQSFEDFIAEKTGVKDEKNQEKNDIFSEEKTEKSEKKSGDIQNIKEEKQIKNDIFSKEKKQEEKQENKEEVKQEEVPDWLKGTFDETGNTKENTIEEVKQEDKQEKTQEAKKQKAEKIEEIKQENTENLDEITKIEEDDIPDWLKGSFDESDTTKEIKQDTKENKQEIKQEKQDTKQIEDTKQKDISKKQDKEKKEEIKQENTENLEEITKIEEDNIPDWLKGSLEEDKNNNEDKNSKEEKSENNKQEPKQETKKTIKSGPKKEVSKEKREVVKQKEEKKKTSTTKKTKPKTTTKKSSTKTTTKSTKKDDEVKNIQENKETQKVKKEGNPTKKEDKKTNETSDLWDDGMDIPDWLKS